MKPRRKPDPTLAHELCLLNKEQTRCHGTATEHNQSLDTCVQDCSSINQPIIYEDAKSAWPSSKMSLLRPSFVEDNSAECQCNPCLDTGEATRLSQSSLKNKKEKICENEQKNKVELKSEKTLFHGMKIEHYRNIQADDCNEINDSAFSEDGLVRERKDIETFSIVSDCLKKSIIDEVLLLENIVMTTSELGVVKQNVLLPVSREELATGAQDSSSLVKQQSQEIVENCNISKLQDIKINNNERENNHDKMIVGDNLFCKSKTIMSNQFTNKIWHELNNVGDECGSTKQEKVCTDEAKIDGFISDIDQLNQDHCFGKTSIILPEHHLNNDDIFARKRRRSLQSPERITPKKMRTFEMSLAGLNIWNKMEDLCEDYNEQSHLDIDKMQQKDSATLKDFTFLAENKLQLPVNSKYLLTRFLASPFGLHNGPYLTSQAGEVSNENNLHRVMSNQDNSLHKTMSNYLNVDCKAKISLRMICQKSRRNSHQSWRLQSRSRSHSSSSSCRSSSVESDSAEACSFCKQSLKTSRHSRLQCHQQGPRQQCLHINSRTSSGCSRSSSDSNSRSPSRCSRNSQLSCLHNCASMSKTLTTCKKSLGPDIGQVIKRLAWPLVLPASVTTLFVAPVTGSTVLGKPPGGAGRPENNSSLEESSSRLGHPERSKEMHDPTISGNNLKYDDREAHFEANTGPSGMYPSPHLVNASGNNCKPMSRNPNHRPEHGGRNMDHGGRNMDHGDESFDRHRYQQGYELGGYNHGGYHPTADPYFSEDTDYENFDFDGGDYENFYGDGQDDYNFSQDSYLHPSQRPPGPNMHYPRRHMAQGYRGPMPQMYAPNGPSYGPRGPGMGPRPRMGPNGPQNHRPQIGPGGPIGPGIRGPSRGPPYGPPRQMRPPGIRGPPAPGIIGGSAGQIGRGGPYPRFAPTPRTSSPMPRHNSQAPVGPRPRMGPPMSGPPPRDGQYPPPRSSLLPRGLMLNLSQPPPNFNVPPSPALPTPTVATPTGNNVKIPDVVEPPPLPPPKPPTPKPPPPPKKEEEKKEELKPVVSAAPVGSLPEQVKSVVPAAPVGGLPEQVKPMAPLIPPEQAEQYRRLREQAKKHAKKQLRKQEHRAKGEPESSDDDDEEKAKKKEYEARLAAERDDIEKTFLTVEEDDAGVDGATILMPAPQPALLQQPTYVFQHHPISTLPSSYGLMSVPHFVHSAHPAVHPSQLQNVQFVTSPAQPQLVQLPNGQMAYASPAPLTYQAMTPMVSVAPQGVSPGAMPHQMVLSSGGIHQMPVAAHPGIAVAGNHYASQVMAAQIQAAQQQAAQVQAAQVQAAQVQAAQVQAAQVQAAQQAAQVQAAQAQQAQLHGLVPGVHVAAQHVMPAISPQGQIILVPRVARPQM